MGQGRMTEAGHKQINLNADMGESFGRYVLGNDEAMIRHVASINVACGYHAAEPFAALDAFTRRNLQLELKALWERTNKTIVFITHDIDEALILGTDIIVLSSGPASTISLTLAPGLGHDAGPSDREWVAARRAIADSIQTAAHR